MISIRKVMAILTKQLKDTLKNKGVLIQFVMFPLLTVILVNSMDIDGMPENYFVTLFSTMYIGMAPLISMSSIIAEEKEVNTLRVLLMSNVKAVEYFIGIGSYTVVLCLLGAAIIGGQGGYNTTEYIRFLVIMLGGILTSSGLGAVIGVCSKNQMSATALTVPLMMVFSFLPMIASFNPFVGKVSKFFYSQQVNNMIEGISKEVFNGESIIIIAINIAITVLAFVVVFRKFGLET